VRAVIEGGRLVSSPSSSRLVDGCKGRLTDHDKYDGRASYRGSVQKEETGAVWVARLCASLPFPGRPVLLYDKGDSGAPREAEVTPQRTAAATSYRSAPPVIVHAGVRAPRATPESATSQTGSRDAPQKTVPNNQRAEAEQIHTPDANRAPVTYVRSFTHGRTATATRTSSRRGQLCRRPRARRPRSSHRPRCPQTAAPPTPATRHCTTAAAQMSKRRAWRCRPAPEGAATKLA